MNTINEIQELVRNNVGQMTYAEYVYIHDLLQEQVPCSLLIFGLGKDSFLWTKMNREGYTLFIEDNAEWIDKIRPSLEGRFEIIPYRYDTVIDKWLEYLQHENILNNLKMKFEDPYWNETVYHTFWEVVIIDGPAGYTNGTPGRMMPISTVYSLNKKHLMIHDCDRIVENLYSRIFFGNDFQKIHKLRHYCRKG